jgi:ribokinase
VDTSRIITKHGEKTGSVICLSDKHGQRSLYVVPEANSSLRSDDIDTNYINKAAALHISSFVDDRQFKVTLELMERMDPLVKISFSPGALYAGKGLQAIVNILKETHVLFLNEREMRQLTDQDVAAGAKTCVEYGCRIVAVTLGKGIWLDNSVKAVCYIRDAQNEYTIESRMTYRSSDTTGAGDAFAAGFLYGLLNGGELVECGRVGDIMAQFSISKTGARQGLPTTDQLSRRYRELYPV